MFYENQKEDQETSAALRQDEESSDSETEDVVAELKSLSDSGTKSEPDIPLDDAVEEGLHLEEQGDFLRNIWTFLHEVFK